MTINRKELIRRHNPVLNQVAAESPLTVGNGDFGFTVDVTGLQTLYPAYENDLPLCTMSSWGWHTIPVSAGRTCYSLSDLIMTDYDYCGRKVSYPVRKQPGNEVVYQWLRQNPHRMNLASVAIHYQGRPVTAGQVSQIRQELDLYEGIIHSRYAISGHLLTALTAAHFGHSSLVYSLSGSPEVLTDISFVCSFPYGSHRISGAEWQPVKANRTEIVAVEEGFVLLKRMVDDDVYWVAVQVSGESKAVFDAALTENELEISLRTGSLAAGTCPSARIDLVISFFRNEAETKRPVLAKDILASSRNGWQQYWEQGGIIKLHASKDPRAEELERRIILSRYLLLVNSCGSQPPQETGMTCNSWYGKAHLEMYLWHCAWLALWGHADRLKKSVDWYQQHLAAARENAARNRYQGARWPKMVAADGIDSPSEIAPLLIWQQPHIIYVLELIYQAEPGPEILEEYWELIAGTADFMVDFAVYDEGDGRYHLMPPIIPVQERYSPEDVKDPSFEVEYWHVTLSIAAKWADRMNKTEQAQRWQRVSDMMALPHVFGDLYQGHARCDTTYKTVNEDHPSMTGAMGLLKGERLSRRIMRNSLKKILACWDYESLWGWDFAMLAMTAVRLGEPELALDILLADTAKNTYTANGNNNQKTRADLPLYLPGNGSLLLAMPLFCAGVAGDLQDCPGFPKDGSWQVEYEGLKPFIE